MAKDLGYDRLSIRMVIDSNLIRVDREQPLEVEALFHLHQEQWVELARTDVLETELMQTPDLDKRHELMLKAIPLIESYGPLVLGHSRLDATVVASEADKRRLSEVFSLLFPTRDWETADHRDQRDAMHIATAIRYGNNGFVTNDKPLLRATDEVAKAFNGFRIWSPKKALEVIEGLLKTREKRLGPKD